MPDFAQKLKRLRVAHKLTQEDLALQLGLSGKSAISNWEKGSNKPDNIEIYIKLSELFKVSLDSLIKDKTHYALVKEANTRYSLEQEILQPDRPYPQYPLVGRIPAGKSEVQLSDWVEMEVIDFDPNDHALLMIDEEYGHSMTPIMQPGDVIMISFKENKFESGDIVAARWDDTKGAIKILTINDDDRSWVSLHSSNSAEPPIFLKRNKVKLFRVVAWFDRQKNKEINMILKSGAFSNNKKPFDDLRDLEKDVFHPPYDVIIHSHKIPDMPTWLNKEYKYKDVKYNPYKVECNCDVFLSRSAHYPERDVRTVCIHLYGKIMFSAKDHIDKLTKLLLENNFKYGVQHLHKFEIEGRTHYLGFTNNPDWIKVYQSIEEWKEYSYSILEDRWAYRFQPSNAYQIKEYIISIIKDK